MIKQLIFIVSFVYWVLSYSYTILTPSVLLSNNHLVNFAKELSQTYNSFMLNDGFDMELYMDTSSVNFKNTMNMNPDLIDVLICNHVSTLDFLIVMSLLQTVNISGFNFVLKNEIIYAPGFGYIMYANSDIKLNRSWEKDKETFGKQIDRLIKNSNGTKQVILIFPEGTRLTSKKLKEGQEFSVKNNIQVFNNLLVPKTKGLWYLINYLKEKKKLGRVWDITLAIPKFIGKSAYMTDVIGKSLGPVYFNIRQLDIPDQTQDLENFKNWFLKNWKIKDDFMQFYKNLVYQKIEIEDKKYIQMAFITIICLLTSLLMTNKYGRYYLIISLVLSYVLILFKL